MKTYVYIMLGSNVINFIGYACWVHFKKQKSSDHIGGLILYGFLFLYGCVVLIKDIP